MTVNKNESGITLIELMVAIAIIGVVISALYLSYFSSVGVFSFNRAQTEFHRDQRLISENIAKKVRSAESINDNFNPGSLPIAGLLLKNDDDEKIFFGINSNNYFYVDNDPAAAGGERVISQNKISVDSNIFNYTDGVLEMKITLINNDGKEYTFIESYNPRLSDIDVSVTL